MKLYVTRDKIAQSVSPCFESPNDLTAIRTFSNAMKDQPLREDYQLYAVGEIDKKTGKLTPEDPRLLYEIMEENK